MGIFCTHDWKVLSENTTVSRLGIMNSTSVRCKDIPDLSSCALRFFP